MRILTRVFYGLFEMKGFFRGDAQNAGVKGVDILIRGKKIHLSEHAAVGQRIGQVFIDIIGWPEGGDTDVEARRQNQDQQQGDEPAGALG